MNKNSDNIDSFGNQIYSGTAIIGKVKSLSTAIIFTILSIIAIIFGIKIITNRNKMKQTEGNVVERSSCVNETFSDGKNSTKQRLSCNTFLTYTIDGIKYEKIPISTDSTVYLENQKIILWYDTDSPNNPTIYPLSSNYGYLLIAIAIIIFISSWSWVYITQKSKFAASATGVGETLQMITPNFNNRYYL